MLEKRQKGFGTLEIIVIVLFVILLGAGGWYVWHKNKNGVPVKATMSQGTQSKQPSTTADPSDGGKYLVIKEWGVRFSLPEDLQGDVRYGIETSTSDNTQTAWFEVGKLAKLPGSNCKLSTVEASEKSGQSGGIGSYILRTSNKVGADQEALLNSPNMQIENYWYSGGYGKYADSCMSNESYQQLASDTGMSLTTAFKSLKQL